MQSLSDARYDIVFVDPPFGDDLWTSTLDTLEKCGALSVSAWIYVESPADREISAPHNWLTHRDSRAGAVRFTLYRRA